METGEQLLQSVKEQMDDPVKVISLLEHQLDLSYLIIHMLVEKLKENGFQFDDKFESMLEFHKQFLQYSSVDFDNLDSQFQGYKLPMAIEKKGRTRTIQDLYLKKKVKKGIL